MAARRVVPLRLPLTGRDPGEPHRAATPLELLFDLVFVVAIASAAAQWHHDLADAHYGSVVGFVMVFVAIWWAWMNYTWFASAYDTDDVGFRLHTFVVMTGALLLAAGVPDLAADGQSVLVVVGYVVMRLAMVSLWLRVARDHPERRRTAVMYAVGIAAVQLVWIARLAITDERWLVPSFLLAVALELSVPYLAELRGGITSFHPHHIAERYALLTIIVLGEVILSTVQAIQGVLSDQGSVGGGHLAPVAAPGAAPGVSAELVRLVVGGLLLVFSLWWLYFTRDLASLFTGGRRVFGTAYGHLVVFGAGAAVGSALAAAVDVVERQASAGPRPVGIALGVATGAFVTTVAALHAVVDRSPAPLRPAAVASVAVLVVPWLGGDMGTGVLATGVVVAIAVAWHEVRSARTSAPAHRPD